MFETIEWTDAAVVMLDQRRLPGKEIYLTLRTPEQVAAAIRSMAIRGAPAIGVAAAMGLALGAKRIALGLAREPAFRRPSRIDRRRRATGTPADRRSRETARGRASLVEFQKRFECLGDLFAATRPTAVNLFWAIERMKRVGAESIARAAATGFEPEPPQGSPDSKAPAPRKSATRTMVREASSAASAPTSRVPPASRSPLATVVASLVAEARRIKEEDVVACRAIGRYGEPLVPDGARILTHCNAGALATAGYGTALGVVRAAHEAGKHLQVFADETRPFLQGARLTAWELLKDGIDTTVITDGMAGHFFRKGEITLAVVGADRIAANGDVANKIGTYQIAVLAKENGIPFYVAAPLSSIDLSIPEGDQIPIEERSPDEVTHAGGARVAPAGVSVRNPAFDVTPNRYITAIITERGVARAPYDKSLRALFPRADR